MFRFLFRFIGFFVLAAAFVSLLYDGTKSIAAGEVRYTPLREILTNMGAMNPQALQAAVERLAPDWVWSAAILPVLNAPASLVLAILGVLLLLMGRKKKPLIGYAR